MRNLKSQFNKLQEIKPDDQWKKDNREVLLHQIGINDGVRGDSKQDSILIRLFNIFQILFRQLSQPIGVVMLLISIMIGGGVFGVVASNSAKPGDSLYIAKIINEKAQLALTFNKEEKIKLALVFAENRTREIAKVVEEIKAENNKKQDHLEKLTQDFKEEIIKIKKSRKENIASRQKTIEDNKGQVAENNEDTEVVEVFSAYLGRSEKGMQVSQSSTFDQVLDEAEALINNKDYNGTLEKLEQANAIIAEEAREELSTQVKDELSISTSTKDIDEQNIEIIEQESGYDIIVDNPKKDSYNESVKSVKSVDNQWSGEAIEDSLVSSSEETTEEEIATSSESDIVNNIQE